MHNQNCISYIKADDGSSGWIEATIQFVNADEEDIGTFVNECMELGALGSMETSETDTDAGKDDACESCGPSVLL